jgi:hypothetical protein
MKDEKAHCEEVAERIIREGWGQGYRVIHRGLADLIAKERAAAIDEYLAENTPVDEIMAAWSCTKDIVPELTAERIRPRIVRAIKNARSTARREALEEAATVVAADSNCDRNCSRRIRSLMKKAE